MEMKDKIISTVKEVLDSKELKDSIEATIVSHVNSIVKSAIDDVFGYNGHGRKKIKALITEQVYVPDTITLPAYGALVAGRIEAVVKDSMQGSLMKKVDGIVQQMIDPIGPSYKLSDLIEVFRDQIKSEVDTDDYEDGDRGNRYYNGSCTIEVKNDGSFIEFYLDKEEGVRKHNWHNCNYRFMIFKSGGHLGTHLFAVTIAGSSIEDCPSPMGGSDQFAHLLSQLQLARTHIEIDIEIDGIDNEIEIEEEE